MPFALSPGDEINLADPYQLAAVSESVCIIAEKVYASCQQRECSPAVTASLPIAAGPFTLVSMHFSNGQLIPASIVITPLPDHPNFARVQFTTQIPYTLTLRDSLGEPINITGNITDIFKDIVLYHPPPRPEFNLALRVETRAELIGNPLFTATTIQIPVGIFIIAKITGLVQLLIPAFGYCPEPPACEAPLLANPCLDFLDPATTPFPADFFPAHQN